MKNIFDIKLIFLFTCWIYSFDLHSCEINSCKNILILNEQYSDEAFASVFNSKNCTQTQEKEFFEFIKKTNGKISNSSITEYLPSITLNQQIVISSLENFLKQNIDSNQMIQSGIKTFSFKSILCLDNYSIKVECENCKTLGNKSFQVFLKSKESQFNFSGQFIFQKIVNTYGVIESIQPGQFVGTRNFEPIEFLTDNPSNFIQSTDGLEFFQANKKISPKEPIKMTDLTAAALVSYGKSLKVILKNGSLSLTSEGKSLGNANYGQPVQVNINGKISTGKATNFNEVTLDL